MAGRRDIRVLLTEGSSLTSREVITCLGPPGYELEVLDADPLCVARFSRWVRRVHRCPPAGADPLAYVRTLERVVAERGIDVVLPTHEQAWLLSCARPLLASSVWVALAGADAFARVQSKIAFAQLLDELGLPQPEWRLVQGAQDLDDLAFPYWLKSAFSTAGQGVREVVDTRSRETALAALLDHPASAPATHHHERGDRAPLDAPADLPLMAQQPARGRYGQVQGLFDRGRLVAVHTADPSRGWIAVAAAGSDLCLLAPGRADHGRAPTSPSTGCDTSLMMMAAPAVMVS